MKRKLIFGSIGIVFLLTALSMFSVISAQDAVKQNEGASPLYVVRSDVATETKDDCFITDGDYLGKYNEDGVYVPELNALSLEKVSPLPGTIRQHPLLCILHNLWERLTTVYGWRCRD